MIVVNGGTLTLSGQRPIYRLRLPDVGALGLSTIVLPAAPAPRERRAGRRRPAQTPTPARAAGGELTVEYDRDALSRPAQPLRQLGPAARRLARLQGPRMKPCLTASTQSSRRIAACR